MLKNPFSLFLPVPFPEDTRDEKTKREATRVVVIFLVFIAFVTVGKDLLIKPAVEAGAKYATGAEVRIDHFSLGLISQSVSIKGLRVYNPPGFPENEILLDMPEVVVKCDVPALLFGKLHLPYVRISLKAIKVIKQKGGKANVNALKFADQSGQEPMKGAAKRQQKRSMPMQFDLVSLNVGKVIVDDYSRGGAKPRTTVLEINLKDREFRNVTSPEQLGSAIILSALTPAGLDSVFNLGAGALDGVTGLVGGTVKKVGGRVKTVGSSLTGVLDGLFKK